MVDLVAPIYRREPRSWHERLFTRPWRPWQSERLERDLDAEYEVRLALRQQARRDVQAMAPPTPPVKFTPPPRKDWTATRPLPPAPPPSDEHFLLSSFVFSEAKESDEP